MKAFEEAVAPKLRGGKCRLTILRTLRGLSTTPRRESRVGLTGFAVWGFNITDTVLVAFIISTTANIVGLFVLVAKWMCTANSPDKALEAT